MYHPRLVEGRLRRLAEHFPVVLVVGARQVGKTTLVQHMFDTAATVTFDPVSDPYGARADPEFFLDQHPTPVILDEVQYAPEVLPAIKRRVDTHRTPGQYILTGSQNLALLRQVSESLAGRVAVLELACMTVGELAGLGGEASWLERWLANPGELARRSDRAGTSTLVRTLWRGGFPALAELPDDLVPEFLSSYVLTYVERDVRVVGDVQDQHLFGRFLGLASALSAQEINHAELGRELGVTPRTASRWLALLSATYLWSEVPPYQGNAIKRLSRRPKGYLADSGLAAHLRRVGGPEAIAVSPALGSLFETFVATEILKMAAALSPAPAIHHWRSHGGAEVDLLLEVAGEFWPIEIKHAASPGKRHLRGVAAFKETHPQLRVRPLLVVCGVDRSRWLAPDALAIPWNLA